jgi:hypothetical protein
MLGCVGDEMSAVDLVRVVRRRRRCCRRCCCSFWRRSCASDEEDRVGAALGVASTTEGPWADRSAGTHLRLHVTPPRPAPPRPTRVMHGRASCTDAHHARTSRQQQQRRRRQGWRGGPTSAPRQSGRKPPSWGWGPIAQHSRAKRTPSHSRPFHDSCLARPDRLPPPPSASHWAIVHAPPAAGRFDHSRRVEG